jgi:hypothetical protein
VIRDPAEFAAWCLSGLRWSLSGGHSSNTRLPILWRVAACNAMNQLLAALRRLPTRLVAWYTTGLALELSFDAPDCIERPPMRVPAGLRTGLVLRVMVVNRGRSTAENVTVHVERLIGPTFVENHSSPLAWSKDMSAFRCPALAASGGTTFFDLCSWDGTLPANLDICTRRNRRGGGTLAASGTCTVHLVVACLYPSASKTRAVVSIDFDPARPEATRIRVAKA